MLCRCRPKPLYASPCHRQDLRLDVVPSPGLSLTSPALPLRVNASPCFALPMLTERPAPHLCVTKDCCADALLYVAVAYSALLTSLRSPLPLLTLALRCRCMFKAIQHAAISLACPPIRRFDALPTRYITFTNLAPPARSLPCPLRVAVARPSFTIHCCTRRGAIYNFTSLCLRLPLHGASPRYAGADSTQNYASLYHGNLVHRFALQNRGYAILSLPSTCFASLRLLCPR